MKLLPYRAVVRDIMPVSYVLIRLATALAWHKLDVVLHVLALSRLANRSLRFAWFSASVTHSRFV